MNKNPSDVKWVIDQTILESTQYTDLVEIVSEKGYDVEVIKYVPFSSPERYTNSEKFKSTATSDDLALVYGTVNFVEKNTHIFGNYFRNGWFNLVNYRTNLNVNYEDWLNRGIYTTWKDLKLNHKEYFNMLNTSHIFIRPNSGHKTFTGFDVHEKKLLDEINSAQQLTSVLDNTLIQINNAVFLEEEYRFFIFGSKVSAWSRYRFEFEKVEDLNVPEQAIWFAQSIANNNTHLEYPLVLDVAKVDRSFKIIEINCINSSGFYAANVNSIIDDFSAFVTNDWNRLLV